MSLYVVDASIAVKLYVPEVHSAQAVRFFSDEHELIVPEFMLAEVANVVWKKATLLGEISESEAQTLVSAVQELPLGLYYTAGLLNDALKIALQTKRSVYDSLYLALAHKEGCQLMTDDRKLFDALQPTALAESVILIENY
ncbi:MAG: type II toxin-antitoxin system VapC family toxin [Acidobacteriota bacterium]